MIAKVVYKGKDNNRQLLRGGKPVLASRISHFVNYPWVIEELLGPRRNRP